ncbi:MAG: hypothetical protein DRI48_02690 [Chloroflexi bacterium]|nr:MAG: hypothetical protein DRI48_02690 [Chloroflexota bacterium]
MKKDNLAGTRLGEYQIVEQVGRGATSTIYKAFQPKLNRYVAIKVLRPFFADEEAFRERFVREAQAVAQLDHPNILPIYDFDQHGDFVYLVMQYVDSGSLADVMGQPMPLTCVLEIVEQIGRALSYAHDRGIVHRDVKPGNILLGVDNWVLLTDFGLVKILEDPKSLTQSGVGMGTPNYMSPEQVRGDPVDRRADVYALGATVYQMVTGHVPFEGESGMAVALKHLNEPLAPPRTLNPDLPPDVDRVIVKALAKDRNLRYETVEEFVSALRDAVAGTPSDRPAEPSKTMTRESLQPTTPLGAQTCPTLPSASITLESIWAPLEDVGDEKPAGGSGWTLLAALVGTFITLVLLFWGLALGLHALLEGLP